MPQTWIIHGVPTTILRDGWWLDNAPPPPTTATGRPKALAVLLALVLLADILFYGHSIGVSLALFAVVLFAATLTRRPSASAVAVLTASVLPTLDYVQPLSVVILIAGLITSITLTRRPSGTALLPAALTLLRQIPWRGIKDLHHSTKTTRISLGPDSALRGVVRAWAFPVGGTMVLLSLLAQANPILDGWLAGLGNLPFDPAAWLQRALFWGGVALLIWPLLVADVTPPSRANRPTRRPLTLGLNPASVANALMAFNLILALQTVLDARYLWSGAQLPPGMTLASYAHRGAYPLLATALLAGGFALAARPYLTTRRALKPLLILWLGQNILLTLSALYRLDLYVQAFGLTYLRVYALIWMALVAAGLALTLTQIAAAKSNPWLLRRCTVLAAATLYACAFVNFAALIARVNVAEDKVDAYYLCTLGPTAAAAIPDTLKWPHDDEYCNFQIPQTPGWRDWGFRNWRVLHTLGQQEAPYENPRRR